MCGRALPDHNFEPRSGSLRGAPDEVSRQRFSSCGGPSCITFAPASGHLVRADPFDPHDALFEIDGNDQSIIIPHNVEHDSICRDDASGRMAAPYIGCT